MGLPEYPFYFSCERVPLRTENRHFHFEIMQLAGEDFSYVDKIYDRYSGGPSITKTCLSLLFFAIHIHKILYIYIAVNICTYTARKYAETNRPNVTIEQCTYSVVSAR